ncbi:MAG: hypothetical protein UT01_C0011G0009 [Candidatus Daviesbacteria bacterium GW2011_GWA1_38_7]|nr:MAG: hypothetical protein UT01_C0011G0009 [Candidatus Daviesbacteria bacterium GW2011_GWA1_38_7]
MATVNKVAMLLVLVGALNWGLVGLLNLNLVNILFGSMEVVERVVYILVGASAVLGLLNMSKMLK